MGNKPSSVHYDGLPPPIIPLDDGKKKKKKKDKKSKKEEVPVKESKANGIPPSVSSPAVQSTTGTLFRSPRRPEEDTDGQLSKVILPDRDLNIKVYKKSRDNLNDNFASRSRSYRSLPRSKSTGFRKSTDTLLSCESKQTERLLFQQRCSTLANGSNSFNSRWSYVNGHDSPTFRPPGLKGVVFPTEEVILRHASLFEKMYVECFVDHYYVSLPDMVQLSAIIIAYKRIYGHNELDYRPINLRDYFLSEDEQDIPTDMVSQEAKKWFVLAVPPALVSGLALLKGRGKGDKWDQSQIMASIDLVRYVTLEAAKELSRIYEYQIAVVSDAASVQILGRHAAERSAEYLRNGNRFVERDSLIEGTAYLPAPSVSHRNSFGSSRSQSPGLGYVSAIFGDDREQRWEVSHVFASCGLRLDGGGPARRKSWPVFMTSRDALPLVYGYRSPIYKRDFETGTENITQTELATYPEVLQDNPNDFHRDYVPLRIALSNRSSSYDSQSVCSLSTDPRRYDTGAGNGRTSRQSHAVISNGYGHKVNGFVRNGTRTSTLAPSGRYGSLARSVEFNGDRYEKGPSHSGCFQRELPTYGSERTPAAGGRFQKYSNNRPERITAANGEGTPFERGTLRRTIANGSGINTFNRHMNGSIHSLSRNTMSMAGDRVSPIDGTLNNKLPRHLSEFNYAANGRSGSLARLPPKPPVRSVSTSQYNNHLNVPPSHFLSQNFVPSPQTAPVFQTFTRLPPTTETSFDCSPEDVVEPPVSADATKVDAKPDSGAPDFMDFQSFLKLVENQNSNLKLNGSVQTPKPVGNGCDQLETDFPEVDQQPESASVTSNV